MYLQKRDRKLLMNWDKNSVIIEYIKLAEATDDLIGNKITGVSKKVTTK